MFKQLVLLFSLLLLLYSASAYIYMISPVEDRFENNETVDLGSVQPGETIEIIISNNTGLGEEKWVQAIAPESNLPTGWASIDSAVGEETFVVRVIVPQNAAENIYNFKVIAKSSAIGINDESINARLSVEKGLVTASVERKEPREAVYVEQPVYYKIILNNSSIAEHTVVINSTLSCQWFEPQEFTVGPKDIAEYEITVIPRIYGKKEFSFNINSVLNNSEIGSFTSKLAVLPTLKGKYSSALHGFPFFTISLLPYYIINSFISLIIP